MILTGKTFRMNKTGFTLIETIVAFAIIAIILVVAIVGFNTIASVNNRAQAWNQADQELELLIASGDYTEARETTLIVTLSDGTGTPVTSEITGEIRTYKFNGKTLEVFYKYPDQ